ncbi:hypothetical protein HGRIS_014651 [Hohenbuehelia grisea]|uniref:Uncharacterized protein n=1 Tax=Hohenbuehelia grisea TaxID=104357 RepID=A0ABR3JWC3_9AGAR
MNKGTEKKKSSLSYLPSASPTKDSPAKSSSSETRGSLLKTKPVSPDRYPDKPEKSEYHHDGNDKSKRNGDYSQAPEGYHEPFWAKSAGHARGRPTQHEFNHAAIELSMESHPPSHASRINQDTPKLRPSAHAPGGVYYGDMLAGVSGGDERALDMELDIYGTGNRIFSNEAGGSCFHPEIWFIRLSGKPYHIIPSIGDALFAHNQEGNIPGGGLQEPDTVKPFYQYTLLLYFHALIVPLQARTGARPTFDRGGI